MQDLSLHILDIAENSISAQASRIEIRLEENRPNDLLTLEINDNGRGMDEETVKKAMDPFFTTRTTRRVGFGLSLLAEASAAANGRFTLDSRPGEGTRVKATFQLSHIDCKPLGDMAGTLVTLLLGHPEIDLKYTHKAGGEDFTFDSTEIKSQLNGLPINSPQVLKIIRTTLQDGLESIRRKT